MISLTFFVCGWFRSLQINKFFMHFPIIISSMTWFSTIITPKPSLSFSVVWIVMRAPNSQGRVLLSDRILNPSPSITFFLLSSLLTSEHISRVWGNGFIPSIVSWNSSRCLLNPIKNLKILFLSKISLYLFASSGQFCASSSNTSSRYQRRISIPSYWVTDRFLSLRLWRLDSKVKNYNVFFFAWVELLRCFPNFMCHIIKQFSLISLFMDLISHNILNLPSSEFGSLTLS